MSTKVYFRTSDSKAISANIKDKVDYQKSLQTIHNKFKIPKQDIKLIYNGQNQTHDFNLNPQLPHHIIHVNDKRQIKSGGPVNLKVTINDRNKPVSIPNITTDSKTTVKQVIEAALKQQPHIKPENALLLHNGKKLSLETSLEDHDFTGTQNVTLLLQDPLDPSDVEAVTTALEARVPITIDQLVAQSGAAFIARMNAINNLKTAGFFKHFQQTYQHTRGLKLYQQYGPYAWPLIAPGGQGQQ